MKIYNQTRNIPIADQASTADTFLSRMVGLLNRHALSDGEALVITRCNSIHMLFMKFPIDAVFIDQKNYVVGLVKNIKPFQLSRIFWSAVAVIELPAGTIEKTRCAMGDRILFH